MTDPTVIDEPVRVPRRGGRILLVVAGLMLIIGGVLYLLAVPTLPHMSVGEVHQQAFATQDAPPAAPIPFDAGRVAALDTQVDQLRQRVDALEQRVATLSASAPITSAQTGPSTIDMPALLGLNAQVQALSDRQQAQASATDTRLRTDEARLDTAASQAAKVAAVTDRTAKLARVQAAEAALAAGLPLGELPGDLPALDRYRTDPPPTEAQLKLAFPAVATSVRAAARPDTEKLGFWAAMRARVAALITIRRGDRVLMGSSQIGIVDRAGIALDAGDLAEALSIMSGLDGPAAQAAADWCNRAQGLLQARVALARIAAQS